MEIYGTSPYFKGRWNRFNITPTISGILRVEMEIDGTSPQLFQAFEGWRGVWVKIKQLGDRRF